MGLVRELAREYQVPVLCNIHDVQLALEFCNRVIGLQDGVKKFDGPGRHATRRAGRDLRHGGAVGREASMTRSPDPAHDRRAPGVRAAAQRIAGAAAVAGGRCGGRAGACIDDRVADTDWSRIGGALGFWRPCSASSSSTGLAAAAAPRAGGRDLHDGDARHAARLRALVAGRLARRRQRHPEPHIAYPIGRFLMVMCRSVHEIIWALLFVSAVGLGALPGMLAVAMRSVGFISKITAEAIENIDPKPVEAIRAAGGTQFQSCSSASCRRSSRSSSAPSSSSGTSTSAARPSWAWSARAASGWCSSARWRMFNYGGVTMVILAILALIAFGEVVSHYARKAVI